MAKYKVEVDEEACIGCGACAASAPGLFEMKDGDKGPKAVALKPVTEKLDEAKGAAEVCPVNCIHLTAEDGSKII